MQKSKTYVYVDGFNLYYGAIKGTKFHWLNLHKLCEILLTQNEIVKIKYFTAIVSPRNHDPKEPIRQQTYIRALKTLPSVEVIYGHYLSHVVKMPLAKPLNGLKSVAVIKTEEKGSDVNLACHLLHDAHLNHYETAVVISNDSDLAEPVRLVSQDLNKKVGIINPHRHHPSRVLQTHATFIKQIRAGLLGVSQFPPILEDNVGKIHIPEQWK